MNRRAFVTSLVAVVTAPRAAQAQPAGKRYVIGVLSPEGPLPGLLENFRQGLQELGYTDGKDVVIEWRDARGKNEQLGALADELVRRKVDIILAVNTPAALAAKKATTTIPIVITRVADPVKSGLVRSLSHPGGNITGVTFIPDVLGPKQLQLLKDIVPSISRVAVIWYADNPGTTIIVNQMDLATPALGLQLLRLPVKDRLDLAGAFRSAAAARAEALVVADDAMIRRHRIEILDLAAKRSLPVVSLYKEFVEAGGLFAYGANPPAIYQRAAYYVDRILKGAKPGDLPIEQPTKFDLVVNVNAAKALGLTIPPSLLARADQVIE